jgi:outer membrane receptor protein involved in Fe transport
MVVPRLQFLPKPLDGLGFSANLTLLDPTPASITMSDGVTRRRLTGLFESSDMIANARLFYTIGPVTLQGAWNHRSPILYSVSTADPLQDRQVASSDTFDAQIRIKAIRGITIIGQARNLTNERPQRLTGPDFGLLREELDNGRAYYLGAAFKF